MTPFNTGAYPPGCTQTECDQAQPGYWDEPLSETDELESHIDALMQAAESGEQWAEICRLEEILINLRSTS